MLSDGPYYEFYNCFGELSGGKRESPFMDCSE